ncbi:MAG: hypothetical protein ACHQ6T_02755 [Myxococcota bacterium]
MTGTTPIDSQGARVAAYAALGVALLFAPYLWIGIIHPLIGSDAQLAASPAEARYSTLFAIELSEIGWGGLLIVFGGGLWAVLRRAEGGAGLWSAIAFAACVATAVTILACTTFLAAIAHMAPNLDPATLRALYDIALVANLSTAFPNAVYPAAAAKVILETRVLPAWVAYGAIAVAATHLASSMSLAPEGLWSPGGLLPSLAPITHLVWLVAIAVALLRARS